MSLLIDHLVVTAFRGIRDTVELDLTTPLTLLYAPNGSGKTSLFDALAWLLYGKDLSVDAARNQSQGQVAPPSVAAKARLVGPGASIVCTQLSRVGSGVATGAFGTQRIQGRELVRRLARNHDLSQYSAQGGAQERRYQQLIRATRFLSSDGEETMGLHDDGNMDASQVRTLLFADLTDTTHLDAELRQVANYRLALEKAQRELQERSESAHVEYAAAEKRRALLPDLAPIIQRLTELLDVPAASAGEEILAAAEGLVTRRIAAHRIERKDLGELFELIPSRSNDEAQYEEMIQRRQLVADNQAHFQRLADQTLAHIAKREDDQRSLDRRHINVSEGLSRLQELIFGDPMLANWQPMQSIAQAAPVENPSMLVACIALLSRREQWISALAQVSANAREIERQRAVLTQVGTVDAGALTAAEAELAAAEESARSDSEQLETLRRMALTWQERSAASHCPCCEHDWSSAQALTEALTRQRSGPSATVTHQIRLREQVDGMRAARARLEYETGVLRTLLEKQRDLDKHLHLHRGIAATIGIELNVEAPRRLEAQRDGLLLRFLHDLEQRVRANFSMSANLALVQTLLAEEMARLEADRTKGRESILNLQRQLEEARSQSNRLSSEERDSAATLQELQSRLRRGEELAAALNITPLSIEALVERRQLIDEADQRDAEACALLDRLRTGIAIQQEALRIPELRDHARTLDSKGKRVATEIVRAKSLQEFISEQVMRRGKGFFDVMGEPISELFGHMQINRAFERIQFQQAAHGFQVRGLLDEDTALHPLNHFSQGQQQDLALAMFLARAATLGGSFFLDEPLRHLDDLNRTALLDVLRAAVLGTRNSVPPLRLMVTTASRMVVDHIVQKFHPLMQGATPQEALLRVYELSGNPRAGVVARQVFPHLRTDDRPDEDGTSLAQPSPESGPTGAQETVMPEYLFH